jgi:periplasmic divalent cation tolerance protein
MSESFNLVLCTAPSRDVGAELARGLVEAGLAACVNVVPGLESFYVWEGKLQKDAEVQLLVKTRAVHLEAIERFLGEHHPYEVPEILFVPITGGSSKYLEWVTSSTSLPSP